MNAKIWNRTAVVGVVGVGAALASGSRAQAEPPVFYARAYQQQPAYIDYGTPYVTRSMTVTYAQPSYVQPAYQETVVVQPPVTVVRPIYARPYCAPRPVYNGPVARPYYRPHYVARPYYRAHATPYYRPYAAPYYRGHGHSSWGVGVAGGHHGGGFSFYYNR